jgi:hypothetical protein
MVEFEGSSKVGRCKAYINTLVARKAWGIAKVSLTRSQKLHFRAIVSISPRCSIDRNERISQAFELDDTFDLLQGGKDRERPEII